jgi:hypothetical protein
MRAYAIFDKYSIPYEMKIQTEIGKTPRALLAIMGIALGAFCLYGLSKIGDSNVQQGKSKLAPATLIPDPDRV